jgi:hypothetical protein
MKRLMISALAAVALFVAATTMLRSHTTSANRAVATSMPGFATTIDVNKLPIEDFEDQSMVYSKATR